MLVRILVVEIFYSKISLYYKIFKTKWNENIYTLHGSNEFNSFPNLYHFDYHNKFQCDLIGV